MTQGAPRFGLRLLLPPMLLLLAAATVLAGDLDLALWLSLRTRLLPWGAPLWSGLTLLGDALVSPLLIIPFLHRRPRLGVEGALAAILATVCVHTLKPLVRMPRPAGLIDSISVIGPRLLAGSFPSGHTASAFTVLGLLVAAGLLRGTWPLLAGFMLAALVGLSRVVVGAHWPVDVLAGGAIGWCCGSLGVLLAERLPGAGRASLQGVAGGLLAVFALIDLLGHDTGYPAGLWLQRGLALAMLLLLLWQQFRRRRT